MTKIIVTGEQTEEGKKRFLRLEDCEVILADHPLWTTRGVYLTPHISGGFRAGVNYDSVIDVAIRNLQLFLAGEKPIHVVDRKLGY